MAIRAAVVNLTLNGYISNGDTTAATTNGLEIAGNSIATEIYLNNCDFSTVSGIKTALTNDIQIGANSYIKMYLKNTKLGSSTQIIGTTGMLAGSFVRSHNHNAVSNAHKTWRRGGTIENETTIRHTASGYSWKNTPASSSNKLTFPGIALDTLKAAVNANLPVTITCYVRYDSLYNGNMPRLVLVGGVISGITNDVTDSAQSSNADAWDQLSVVATPTENGVIEFYVDGDGTAGNFYVDDFDVSQ